MRKFKSSTSLKAALAAMGLFAASTAANADIVQNDDVIITFSLCVGNDCVNGESFGFDTIRLKENNLRIHFDDTSTTASFPSNDWRIVVNDSGNGGTNHWSVEDSTAGRSPFRIEAGASANALVIEADSDIGIGTLDPVVELHVVDGDSPTLRLEQNGSSGFTPQTFDLAANEANFFIRDVTNGSQLPFRIKPGADSDLLFLDADNQIGINTDSPNVRLHVRESGSSYNPNAIVSFMIQDNANTTDDAAMAIVSGSAGSSQIGFGDNAGGNSELNGRLRFINSTNTLEIYTTFGQNPPLIIDDDDATNLVLASNGARLTAGGTWTNSSSRTLKMDINKLSLSDAETTLTELEPVTFRYKKEPGDTQVGFIAEDVPDMVATEDRKGLSSMDIVAVLTKVVKGQRGEIAELKERLKQLEN
ncbi:MAG: tail fiber domain-containing protein [Pseudomonadota bacterium]